MLVHLFTLNIIPIQKNITEYKLMSQKNEMNDSQDVQMMAVNNQQNDDYDHAESTVVKRDEKGNVIKQWTEVIKIIRVNKKKPFIGGFRHINTGAEYWNAFAQTDQKRTQHKLCYTRETQTHEWVSKSTKVKRQIGTQMEKEGIFIDTRTDKVVEPNMYFDSDMWYDRRWEAALYIQRLVRGWFARRRSKKLRKVKEDQYLKEMEMVEKKRKNQEIKHREQIERRRNPKSKKDFDILYHELEIWRVSELEKIRSNKSLTEDQRKRALKDTLDKEIDLLQTIDRLKIASNKTQKVQKIEKYLKDMSDPKQWTRASDGRVTEVHTPFTIRAKELMDLYKGLKMKNISTDERLDILLNTKWTVKEWDCNLTRQIVELIDREANMLDRGRPEKSLEGLRQRLANLFLQFIQYPLFNPEAARFQKIPYEISELAKQEGPSKSKVI